MASLNMTKTLKSAVAVIVSGSLFFTTTAMPVAAQTFRAGTSAQSGSAARAVVAPLTLNGAQAVPSNLLLGSSSLLPALSPAAAPSALAQPRAAAVENNAKPVNAVSAAKAVASEASARPDLGPRWVTPDSKPALAAKAAADSKPAPA